MAAYGLVEREQTVVVAGKVENGGQVEFEEPVGDGEGALVVETPLLTVGQNASAQLAGYEVLEAPQVAQHLGRTALFVRRGGRSQRFDSTTASPNP